jgi:hypothetical protein
VGIVAKTPFTGAGRLARRRIDYDEDSRTISGNAFPRIEDAGNTLPINPDQPGDPVSVDFPWAVGFGLSLRPRSAFTISADYTRTFWSDSTIRHFFTLERVRADGTAPVPSEEDGTRFPELPYPTLRSEPPQADTDRQYFRSKTGSIPRFNGFTVGTGLLRGPFLFDVAYVTERGDYLDPESDDRVFSRSGRLFVSLIYRHGTSN